MTKMEFPAKHLLLGPPLLRHLRTPDTTPTNLLLESIFAPALLYTHRTPLKVFHGNLCPERILLAITSGGGLLILAQPKAFLTPQMCESVYGAGSSPEAASFCLGM
jgi:hypothetical protein